MKLCVNCRFYHRWHEFSVCLRTQILAKEHDAKNPPPPEYSPVDGRQIVRCESWSMAPDASQERRAGACGTNARFHEEGVQIR